MTVGVIPAPLDPPWRGDGGDTGLGCRWGVEALGPWCWFLPWGSSYLLGILCGFEGEGSQKFGWGNFLASKPILACILACPSAFCCNFGFGVSFTGYDDDVQRERDQDFAA